MKLPSHRRLRWPQFRRLGAAAPRDAGEFGALEHQRVDRDNQRASRHGKRRCRTRALAGRGRFLIRGHSRLVHASPPKRRGTGPGLRPSRGSRPGPMRTAGCGIFITRPGPSLQRSRGAGSLAGSHWVLSRARPSRFPPSAHSPTTEAVMLSAPPIVGWSIRAHPMHRVKISGI